MKEEEVYVEDDLYHGENIMTKDEKFAHVMIGEN